MRALVLLGLTACGRAGFDALPGDGLDAPAGTGYADVVRASKPIAYWRLGESVPSIAFDEGPNAWHGTYDTSAILGAAGALSSDADTAVELDGTTTGVAIADVLDFAGTAPYSLEAWARPRNIDSTSRAICGKKSEFTELGYSLYVRNTDTGFGRYDGSDISEVFAPKLELDVFSHVVGTFDGTTLRIYVNGALASTAMNMTVIVDRDVGFAIGAKGDGTPGFLDGMIDEVAVYDRALSATEVATHFAAR